MCIRRKCEFACPRRMFSLGATPPKQDRTLDELDTAIEKTNATIVKINSLVQQAEKRDGAAQSRQTKLKSILNSICDDCATLPCLIPPTSSGQGSACVVCGQAVISLDPPRRSSIYGGYAMPQASTQSQPVPTEAELRHELASSLETGRVGRYSAALRAASPSPEPLFGHRYRGAQEQKYEVPTRKQMLAKAEDFMRTSTQALSKARELKQAGDEQLRQLKQEQAQLLSRLSGVKRSRENAGGGTTLYHQTSEAIAKVILSTGFRPGSAGLAGGGIYFTTTKELTAHKAKARGVILEAQVSLGRIHTLEARGDPTLTHTKLNRMGFDSVCIAREVQSGHEYVVYRPDQVLSVKRAR